MLVLKKEVRGLPNLLAVAHIRHILVLQELFVVFLGPDNYLRVVFALEMRCFFRGGTIVSDRRSLRLRLELQVFLQKCIVCFPVVRK